MKKGISIWSFPAQTLKESFALAKDAGFEGVEVALDEVGELSLTTTDEELAAIKASAEECGIELYSVASGLYWKYWLTAAVYTSERSVRVYNIAHVRGEKGHSSRYEGEKSALTFEIFYCLYVFVRYSFVACEKSSVKIGADKHAVKFSHLNTSVC